MSSYEILSTKWVLGNFTCQREKPLDTKVFVVVSPESTTHINRQIFLIKNYQYFFSLGCNGQANDVTFYNSNKYQLVAHNEIAPMCH